MKNKQEHITCQIHPGRLINLVCLDSSCLKNSEICQACLKNTHRKCDENLIITKAEMPFLVEMKNPEHMNKGIIESVDSIIQNEIELFIKSIRERKEELLKRLELVDNIDSLLKKESIDKIKSNYNIEYQKDTGKITLQSKTDVSNDIIHDSIGLFKQTVKAKFDKFTNDFENLEFTIKSSFEFENWLVHKNLSLEKHGKGILFSRRGSDVLLGV